MAKPRIYLAGVLLLSGAGFNLSVYAQDPLGLDDFRYKSEPATVAPHPSNPGQATGLPVSPTRLPNEQAAPSSVEGQAVPAVIGLPPDPDSSLDYLLGPQDLLTIQVFQVPELSSRERVDAEGNIQLPLIGSATIGGMTRSQAEAHIAAELARDYLQNPQVNIFVEEYASQRITVGGSVARTGVFPISGPTTLMQVLAMAGGATRVADTSEVILFRQQAGQDQFRAYIIDVDKIGHGELRDPEVIGSDRVYVPESGSAVFFDRVTGMLRIPAIPVW